MLKPICTALSILMLTAACATSAPETLSDPERDPYEKTNRAIFSFNKSVDRAVLKPISSVYRTVTPKPARRGVSNVMRNLREPWTFANDLLQGKVGRAGTTLGRFLLNSAVGIAGIFKVSDGVGIEYHSEDFGQTLAVWGVNDGKYLVLPFLGSSNPRDLAGFGVGFLADPVDIVLRTENKNDLRLVRFGVDILDTRARFHTAIDDLFKEQDPYVIARSAYFQQRAFEIRDGATEDTNEDDLFGDFGEDETLEKNE